MSVHRLTAVLAALVCLAGARPAQPAAMAVPEQDALAEAAARGEQFAARACANCHAIGPAGVSPMAEATPFRVIVHRYPLDQLEEAFAEGLVTGHPAMPAVVFRASEIDDLVAYLETVRAAS